MDASIPTVPNFLKNFLSKPVGTIPRVPIWSLTFDKIPLDLIKTVNDYQENIIPKEMLSDSTLDYLANGVLHTSQGCLFAQGVTIPGDGFTSNAEGNQAGGLFREYVNQGRDDQSKLKVSFLDTSLSFVEHVIRPWVIVTSFLGMVARKDNYRTTINVHRWGLGDKQGQLTHYQVWKFHGACPINVSSESVEYTVQSGFIRRDVDFVYQKYEYHPGPSNASQYTR